MIKSNQNYTKKQNIYKKTLILFGEMKTKHKQNFLSPILFLNFDNFILIQKQKTIEFSKIMKKFKSNKFAINLHSKN